MIISELKQFIEGIPDNFNVSVCCTEEQSIESVNDIYINADFKQIIIFGCGGNDE